MKIMKTKYLIPVVLLVSFQFAACEDNSANSLANEAAKVSIDEFAAIQAFTTATNSLTQSDKNGLL